MENYLNFITIDTEPSAPEIKKDAKKTKRKKKNKTGAKQSGSDTSNKTGAKQSGSDTSNKTEAKQSGSDTSNKTGAKQSGSDTSSNQVNKANQLKSSVVKAGKVNKSNSQNITEKNIQKLKKKKTKKKKISKTPIQQQHDMKLDEEERQLKGLLFSSDEEGEDEDELEYETDDIELPTPPTQKRKAVWEDEEDSITVKEVAASYSKVRGTRDLEQIANGGEKYTENLRVKFKDVFGNTPGWANLNKKAKADEEEDNEWDPRRKTAVYLSQEDCDKLPKTDLAFKYIDDLNKGTNQGKIIKAVDFIENLKIVLVAGYSAEKFGAVTLFQFNGKENHKIKSVIFPRFPIKCAKFLRSKQRFIVGCNLFPRFFAYDIEEGRKIDILAKNAKEKSSSKLFEVSPDEKYIAFVKNGGLLDIYDANSLSPFEILRVPCEVKAITFSPDSSRLYTTGDNGQVYIMDLIEWSCHHAFYDEGCIEGTAITMSPNGRLLACGSSSGMINVYQTSSLTSSENPQPIKAFGCLTTPVTSLAFNHTSEILAAASSFKDNAIKMIHTRSLTVFSNFPGKLSFKKVHSVSFSPDSKYLVTGDDDQRARLCRLLYY